MLISQKNASLTQRKPQSLILDKEKNTQKRVLEHFVAILGHILTIYHINV
jgi:hypothetical protein